MTPLLTHIKRNAVAYLALFVALGGTSYAAFRLPAGSVGTRALHNGAVTNKKLAKGAVGAADLDKKTIGGYVRYWARVAGDGSIIASSPAAHTQQWADVPNIPFPGGFISWSHRIPSACFSLTTTGFGGSSFATYASASVLSGDAKRAGVYVHLSSAGGQVNVAIVCPQS